MSSSTHLPSTSVPTLNYQILCASSPSPVFMTPDERMHARCGVVIACAEALRYAWRAHPHQYRELEAYEGEALAWHERKLEGVGRGFAASLLEPMPMPRVCLCAPLASRPSSSWLSRLIFPFTRQAPSICFNDGVTRLCWLLDHGAALIPLSCDLDQLEALHELIGVPHHAPHMPGVVSAPGTFVCE